MIDTKTANLHSKMIENNRMESGATHHQNLNTDLQNKMIVFNVIKKRKNSVDFIKNMYIYPVKQVPMKKTICIVICILGIFCMSSCRSTASSCGLADNTPSETHTQEVSFS